MKSWSPALVLAVGAVLAVGPDRQVAVPLRTPLSTVVPATWNGFTAARIELSDAEREVAGVSAYVAREYRRAGAADSAAPAWFHVYVGYYENQTDGRTIHSPRNCLPGGGWEPLVNRRDIIQTPYGPAPVNRYLIQNGNQIALVLYWYQGRGRVAADEYRVKWDLLRDAALRGRTEEALVRIVVPITGGDEETAWALGRSMASRLVHEVDMALPT